MLADLQILIFLFAICIDFGRLNSIDLLFLSSSSVILLGFSCRADGSQMTSTTASPNVVRNIMLTLPTNSANFIGRLFFFSLTLCIGYLFINFGLKDPNTGHVIFKITAIHFEFRAVYIMYFLIVIIGFLALTILSSFLSFNKVLVDTNNSTITFIGLFSKRTISTIDIKEYFDTVHQNAFKGWQGLLIKTNDDKSIQVAVQNVKSLSDLKDYLSDKNIFCAVQKKMKFPFN